MAKRIRLPLSAAGNSSSAGCCAAMLGVVAAVIVLVLVLVLVSVVVVVVGVEDHEARCSWWGKRPSAMRAVRDVSAALSLSISLAAESGILSAENGVLELCKALQMRSPRSLSGPTECQTMMQQRNGPRRPQSRTALTISSSNSGAKHLRDRCSSPGCVGWRGHGHLPSVTARLVLAVSAQRMTLATCDSRAVGPESGGRWAMVAETITRRTEDFVASSLRRRDRKLNLDGGSLASLADRHDRAAPIDACVCAHVWGVIGQQGRRRLWPHSPFTCHSSPPPKHTKQPQAQPSTTKHHPPRSVRGAVVGQWSSSSSGDTITMRRSRPLAAPRGCVCWSASYVLCAM